MSASFFYGLALEHFKLAYESYYKITARVTTLMNTAFSLVGIVIGLCYFVIKEGINESLLFCNGLAIFLFGLTILLGIYTTLPQKIDIIVPLDALNTHYPGEVTEDSDEQKVATIAKVISTDINTLRDIVTTKAKKLLYMQILCIGGLLCFGMSIIILIRG